MFRLVRIQVSFCLECYSHGILGCDREISLACLKGNNDPWTHLGFGYAEDLSQDSLCG